MQCKQKEFENDLGRMREKMEWLALVWLRIRYESNIRDRELFELNPGISHKVVYHYARDLRVLKDRYQIDDMAQAPKIAGLMVNAILKYRPLVPIDTLQVGIHENTINEVFAIYFGICVCANYIPCGTGNGDMNTFISMPRFKAWFDRFIFILRERNYTSESLIMTFETLCFFVFPASFGEDGVHGER
ncbi:MAG: hypothetical protein LBC70_08140 [Chitinispirillales bacterium]|jgi:hypothetical protein|nr:hypothetical protein [Chitinispirillales bacterium]